jgi:hypothetical protein
MPQEPPRPPREVEFLPASDPLWRNTPMPWTAQYSLLGIPLTVETNAPLLAAQAAASFGYSRSPDASANVATLRLRLLLHDVAEMLPVAPVPLMRAQDHYFLLSIGQSLGFADRRTGFAVAYITPALLAHPETVRTCFVECLATYLACGQGRAPLHAAGLTWADRGVLLTGQDGAGKSTLAYACLRAGFQLLAEDIVYAPRPQAQQDLTVWGDARFLHLLPEALRFFPELSSAPCIQQMNGESKLKVCVGELRTDAILTQMPVWGVCWLTRSGTADSRLVSAEPVAVRRALTHFKGDPPLDTDLQQTAADYLLARPLVNLEVGTDLDQAVAVLKHWIEQGSREGD